MAASNPKLLSFVPVTPGGETHGLEIMLSG
jgi:hypothetical protein